MKFFITVYVGSWLEKANSDGQIDVASTLYWLEEELEEFLAVSSGLHRYQIEVTSVVSGGQDTIEYSIISGSTREAEENKKLIEYYLRNFPWDSIEIMRL